MDWNMALMTWTSSAWPWRHGVDLLSLNQKTGSYIILSVGFLFGYWRCKLWVILDGFMMSEVLLWCKDSTIYKGWHCEKQHCENCDECSGASHYCSCVGFKTLGKWHKCLYPSKGTWGDTKYYFWHLERPSQTNGLCFWT